MHAVKHSDARRKAQVKGASANIAIHREKRRRYQEEGRQKAREGNPLHLAGCMLYWAEGTKSRTELRFVNSDADMMIVFIRFLRAALNIPQHKIRLCINCYLNNGITQKQIEQYWLELLQLPQQQMYKTRVNNQPKSSQHLGRKLLYGVCSIYILGTQYAQHVYGAIQEYIGIDKPEWLDC